MKWSERMNLAINYIEANIDRALKIEDVAKQAYCSKYHFHRMFFANFNITCAEYIRRRKLTLAAAQVLGTDLTIVDIAMKFGYESPNAFTRAFKNFHGINPSEARLNNDSLKTHKRAHLPVNNNAGDVMNYRLIDVPEFKVVGKSKEFVFDSFIKDGPKFWKEYVGSEDYKKLTKLNKGRPSPLTNSTMLSVYFPSDSGERHEFTDVLGIEATSENAVNGFECFTVPASTFAEFNCDYKSSLKTNRYIYSEWFSSSGFERDGDKPDIVSYFPIPFRPMTDMQVRWWIPVKKK